MKKKIVALILVSLLLLSSCSFSRKKVDFDYFHDNFNPLSVIGNSNMSAAALTQAYLLAKTADPTLDSVAFIDYEAYTNGVGIADITYQEDENSVLYTVKIGDNVKFSNGKDVTAKDAAFTLYACCDIDYSGWAPVKYGTIDGMVEYQYGCEEAADVVITDEQIENELKNPSEKTKAYLLERVIFPVLEEEYRWVEHLYTDPAYKGTEAEELIKENPTANELFAYYYLVDGKVARVHDKDALIKDIAEMYVTDIDLLSTIYGSDLKESAKEQAKRALTETALEGMSVTKTEHIRGINIIDEKTLTVRLNDKSEDALEKALGVFVVPFDVYGKECSFDGVGFDIDIASVLDNTLEPIGAGPCVFEGYKKGKGVKLSKNKHYFKEEPFECKVTLVETGNSQTPPDTTYFTVYDERLIVK